MSKLPAARTAEAAEADTRTPAHALPAIATDRALSGYLSTDEILRRKQMIATVYQQVMKDGEHYGASFPGDKKKNLLKPGADVLLMTFQLYAELDVEERQFEGHHREYRCTARIRRIGDNLLVATGVGTCSTLESKYRYRNDKRKCPSCSSTAIIKTNKGRNPGGYWCVPDKGGCGANFNAGDPDIEGQVVGKIENTDPADCWNTCLKIGKKRAMVDGTISATGCSDLFTQDIEDLDRKIDAEEAHPSRSTSERNEQLRRDAAAREAPAKAAAPAGQPAVQPAAPGGAPATQAAAAAVNDAAQLEEQLRAAYQKLQVAAGKDVAAKIWKHFGKAEQKPARLAAMDAACAHIKAITERLGKKAEGLLNDLLVDRENRDDVDGILADLTAAAKSPGPAPAVSHAVDAGDEPPF